MDHFASSNYHQWFESAPPTASPYDSSLQCAQRPQSRTRPRNLSNRSYTQYHGKVYYVLDDWRETEWKDDPSGPSDAPIQIEVGVENDDSLSFNLLNRHSSFYITLCIIVFSPHSLHRFCSRSVLCTHIHLISRINQTAIVFFLHSLHSLQSFSLCNFAHLIHHIRDGSLLQRWDSC